MGLLRGKIRWTIPGAGTAYTVLHFATTNESTPTAADAAEAANRMTQYTTMLSPILPNVVKAQVLTEFEEIVAPTNTMLGVYNSGGQAEQTGQASGTLGWAAAAGAVITWNTSGVRKGRRVRGRSFVVPLSNAVWDVDGTIKSTAMDTLNSAANTLRAAGSETQLAVYARPSAPGASDGDQYLVESHRVPDMSAILRSRRS